MKGYPRLLGDLNKLGGCLGFVLRAARVFKASPVKNPHGLTFAEIDALEKLAYHLEVILYQIKTGEIDAQLERKEISFKEYADKIGEIMAKKAYES